MPAKTLRRDFLQLADTYAAGKHKIAGYYISEKLDGTRCFWDGGLTRGMRTEDVPWANVLDPKTGDRKKKIKPNSTGLWSRYGNPILAPDSFLNSLPACPLDGELWAGREKFQLCRSICGGDEADPRFDGNIGYAVYSTPSLPAIFATGEIKDKNFIKQMNLDEIEKFVLKRLDKFDGEFKYVKPGATYDEELLFLVTNIESQNDHVFLHKQTKLPSNEEEARAFAENMLEKLLEERAEGVVIRNPAAVWTPKRHKGLLKYKPFEDAEAVIIGYTAGEEGKRGNVLGKIGNLRVRTTSLKNNVEFQIGSGLNFQQREFDDKCAVAVATRFPGEVMPSAAQGKYLKVGMTITFKYRELSDDGIPKEGRFWRVREGVE